MKKFFTRLLMIACLSGSGKIFSQALYPVSIDEKISHSTLILEGRVLSQYSFWNPTHTMIYTASKVQVYKTFKGSITEPSVEIVTTGGTVGLESIEASDLLTLDKDAVGIFFCFPSQIALRSPLTGSLLLDVYASGQGLYSYDLDAQTANAPFVRYASIRNDLYPELIQKTGHQPVVMDPYFNITAQPRPNSPLAPAITAFSPQLVNAGATLDPANNLLTITGAGFGAAGDTSAVLFDDSNDGSGGTPFRVSSLSPLVQSWSNTEIKIRVPDRAGSGNFQVRDDHNVTTNSPGVLSVNYSISTRTFTSGSTTVIKEANLMNDNGAGGYTILYSASTNGQGVNLNIAPEKATFQRALNTWKEVVGFNVTEGGTTNIQAVANDGSNVIVFDNTNTGNAPLASGVLAVCYSYTNMCTPILTNQIQKIEFDIVIRNEGVSVGSTSFTSGPCAPLSPYGEIDLETVVLHELGHAINMAHVNDGFEGPPPPNRNPPKLMNYSLVFGVGRRSPDYAAYAGALYCVTPQGNSYGACLASGEMTQLSRIIVPVDECPVTFPATSTPPGTSVEFDLVHATSNKFTDPAYNGVDCSSLLGTSVTNNAYYAFRSDGDGGNLNMLVSGYASFPASVQGACAGAGVRLDIFQVNTCPAGQQFPAPMACRTITRSGSVPVVTGLTPNTSYLIYVDGLNNTKANFTLTLNGTALPVSLISFTGQLQNNKVNLYWNTSHQVNGKEFSLEKSFDGTQFSQLAILPVKENGGVEVRYGLVDDKPFPNNSFYRLKIIDKNGDFSYSAIVKVSTPQQAVMVTALFPNPVRGKLNLQVVADKRQHLSVEAFDLLGKRVAVYPIVAEQGLSTQSLQLGNLASGTYFILIKDDQGAIVERTKLIKD